MRKIVSIFTAMALMLALSSCTSDAGEGTEEKSADKKDEVKVSLDLDFGEDKETETKAPEKDEEPTENEENISYLICTEMIFEPFAFTYSNGEAAGFEVDLINEIADRCGFGVYLRDEDFSAGLTALANGDYNGMISAVTKTAERSRKFDFSEPYFTDGVAVIVNKDSGFKKLNDLRGKKLGVVVDSEGEYMASYESETYGYDIVTYDDYTAMYKALEKGSVDAVAEEFSIAAWRIFNMDYDMAVIPEFLWKTNYYFVVPKGESGELLDKFNEGLEALKTDGTYDRILSDYGLDNFVQ